MDLKYCVRFLVILVCYMKVIRAEGNFFYQHINPDEIFSFYSPSYPDKYEIDTKYRMTEKLYTWYFSTDQGYKIKLECPEVDIPINKDENYCLDFFKVNNYENGEMDYCNQFTVTGPSIVADFYSSGWSTGGTFKCDVQVEPDELQEIPNEDDPVVNFQPEIPINYQCGWNPQIATRIVGGKDAKMNEFPSTVLLVHKRGGAPCGGTIITSRVVLSAAHCFVNEGYSDIDAKHYFIVTGEHDTHKRDETGAEKWINLIDIIIHDQYNTRIFFNDIALLITEQEIKFSPKVGPACLPFNISKDDIMGQYLTVVGWGNLRTNGAQANKLQKVQVKVVNDVMCRNHFYPLYKQICTYNQGKGQCQGDSGGPLYYIDPITRRYNVMGIVSYGGICGADPGIFVNVNKYLGWIVNNLKYSGNYL